MNVSLRAAFILTVVASVFRAAPAQEPITAPAQPEISLLTIGNSFANNVLDFLPKVAQAGGYKLVFARANLSGGSMQQHCEKMDAYEKDSQAPQGRYNAESFDDGLSLKEKLTSRRWDFVTIQQFSMISHDPAAYRPYAQKLVDYVRRNAPGAKILVYQTWAYRCDDPQFTTNPLPGKPSSQQEMHQLVSAAYQGIAQELGLDRIPCGEAFYRVDSDPQWGFKPDPSFRPEQAQPHINPPQPHSLHAGWYWRKGPTGEFKFIMDGHHASVAGKYLAALVFFEKMTGKNCADTASFIPNNLDVKFAEHLRAVAHEVVAESTRPDK